MGKAFLFGWMILAKAALAQPVVTPTPDQAGSPRGENTGDYNVVDSVELGYRLAIIGGDLGKYRSDVNFGDGIRLLSSNLTVNSKDGHGRWFDTIVFTTLGLGNDPYQSVTLRAEKNKLYRYDMLWRLDDYYNPGLTIAAGQHLMATSRRMQDHNLTLFPQSKVQLHMGYSRNTQDGPALSTTQLFDNFNSNGSLGSTFPVFSNVRRVQDEFRLGADVELAGFKLTFMHSWVYFREDGGFAESGFTDGDNPSAGVNLTQFQRTAPYHGASPYWLGNLNRSSPYWAVNGRLTYVGGRGDYVLDEGAFGVTPLGAQNQQVVVGGNAARPSVTGDLSISLFPGTHLTVVNNTSVDSTRINGDSAFLQFNNATQTSNTIDFRYLGIRTITNSTDLQYKVNRWLGFYGGYHYSTRQIRDMEDYTSPGTPATDLSYEQENQQQEGLFGVRIKPLKAMTISIETDTGRANHPFTPISPRNYQALGGRLDYRVRKLTLNASYKQNYNNNSITLASYSSRARNYSAGGSWVPYDWLTLDASYAKLHLDTVSGIAFFAGLPQTTEITGLDEIYISNIHAGNFGARLVLKKRIDVYLGYSITRDTGDGRNSAAPADLTGPLSLFVPVETFPLSYQSPLARISVRLSPKLRWNMGWQYYDYHEQFGLEAFYQGYHANTGYSSVSYSF